MKATVPGRQKFDEDEEDNNTSERMIAHEEMSTEQMVQQENQNEDMIIEIESLKGEGKTSSVSFDLKRSHDGPNRVEYDENKKRSIKQS